MINATLEREIHTLSRQEKYHLIQILVNDLESDETNTYKEKNFNPKESYSVQERTSKAQAIDTFLKKWKGSLKGVDGDSTKYQYLHEKYQ